MSSLVTSASPVNYNDNDNNENKEIRPKNQTYKNKDTTKKIKKEMIEHSYNNTDDDSSNLADFEPVQTNLHNNSHNSNPHNSNSHNSNSHNSNSHNSNSHNSNSHNSNSHNSNSNSSDDNPVLSSETFQQLNSPYTQDYYKQYAYSNDNLPQQNYLYQGSYVAPQPSIDSHSELLKKLDNILHLLEEQQEEQTNLITEELILYVFLGVFVIYVLDSFVRVGKYVR